MPLSYSYAYNLNTNDFGNNMEVIFICMTSAICSEIFSIFERKVIFGVFNGSYSLISNGLILGQGKSWPMGFL